MNTRTRKQTTEQEAPRFLNEEEHLDLEMLSDTELEDLLFEDEPATDKGLFNLPTIAGLSLIVVGVAYIFQQLGLWSGMDLSVLANMLPWLAGILIILLGFGVLSWRPKKKKKKVRAKKKAIEVSTGKQKVVEEPKKKGRRGRLVKTRDKKIAGVCGGIADYFNVDPTLIRIAFVIGTIASGGPFLLAYIALAFIMPSPEPLSLEERITIVRDS